MEQSKTLAEWQAERLPNLDAVNQAAYDLADTEEAIHDLEQKLQLLHLQKQQILSEIRRRRLILVNHMHTRPSLE